MARYAPPFTHPTICDDIIGVTVLNRKEVKFINKSRFHLRGRLYTIINTESTGRGIYDAIDIVKNDRGEAQSWKRLDLLAWIETGKTPKPRNKWKT